MISNCFLSPVAEKDIDEVITYLAKENPMAAEVFLDTLFDSIQMLANNPKMGHFKKISLISL